MFREKPDSFGYRKGKAFLGEVDLQDLVSQYKTPLYVLDKQTIVKNCNDFLAPLHRCYSDSKVLYACKANLTKGCSGCPSKSI